MVGDLELMPFVVIAAVQYSSFSACLEMEIAGRHRLCNCLYGSECACREPELRWPYRLHQPRPIWRSRLLRYAAPSKLKRGRSTQAQEYICVVFSWLGLAAGYYMRD